MMCMYQSRGYGPYAIVERVFRVETAYMVGADVYEYISVPAFPLTLELSLFITIIESLRHSECGRGTKR
jgi:hypothetical protein